MVHNVLLSPTVLNLTIICLLSLTTLSVSDAIGAQREAAPAVQTKFRLIRSISGSKGHEQSGRFVMDDPRTLFKVPDDRQVLVYCEWEGVAGQHEFEGLWKTPADKVVAVSDFKLEVMQRRCGGYFTLLLSETAETGIWTLEARVDGEVTGHHRFQIVSAKNPSGDTVVGPAQPNPTVPPPSQPRQPLTESQIYELANSATVLVEKLGAKGQRIDSGSGFFVDAGVLLSAFQVIDGATKLRISLPDGRRLETQEALGWNKWQDWAFLKVDAGQQRFIALPSTAESSVGSRVYALAVSSAGARVIVRCDIVGKNRLPQSGERINLNCNHPDVTGSPVLNEYGDLIGIVGGSLIPGLGSTRVLSGIFYSSAALGNPSPGLLAVPINSSAKPAQAQSPTSLQQLASDGTFTPALARFENIQWGTISRRVEAKPFPRPLEETYEFRAKEGSLIVFLSLQPREKIKASAVVRIHDVLGRLLIESKPSKMDLKPGKYVSYSWWKADISTLKPGIYRVDVLLDSSPMWRAFFRIRE